MVEAVSSDKTGLRPQVIIVCHTPSFRPHNPLSVPPPACMYRAHMSAKGLKEGPCAFAPVWDANKDAPQCTHCNAKFGLLNSRHHCRNWYVQHMTRHVIARTHDLAQPSVSPVSDPRSPTMRVCHQEPPLLRLHVQRPHLLPGLLLREVPAAPHRRQETRSSLPRLLPRALRDSALRRGAGGNAKHIDSMSEIQPAGSPCRNRWLSNKISTAVIRRDSLVVPPVATHVGAISTSYNRKVTCGVWINSD